MGKNVHIEDILEEQLKREMFVVKNFKFRYVDDWDDVLQSIYRVPIEFDGYVKKVSEMSFLREMVDILNSGDFEDVKRSESRRKQLKEYVNKMHMFYNLIFTRKSGKVGYGALIYFPELSKQRPERSRGIVLVAKYQEGDGKGVMKREKARFDDFLLEVKPYIDLLGDLYRKSRKM
jgi:disulfide oxidoreductase YuzD